MGACKETDKARAANARVTRVIFEAVGQLDPELIDSGAERDVESEAAKAKQGDGGGAVADVRLEPALSAVRQEADGRK